MWYLYLGLAQYSECVRDQLKCLAEAIHAKRGCKQSEVEEKDLRETERRESNADQP